MAGISSSLGRQAQGPRGGHRSWVPELLLMPRAGDRQDGARTEPPSGSRAVPPSGCAERGVTAAAFGNGRERLTLTERSPCARPYMCQPCWFS